MESKLTLFILAMLLLFSQGLVIKKFVKLQGDDTFKYLDKFAISHMTNGEFTFKAKTKSVFVGHEHEEFTINLVFLDQGMHDAVRQATHCQQKKDMAGYNSGYTMSATFKGDRVWSPESFYLHDQGKGALNFWINVEDCEG